MVIIILVVTYPKLYSDNHQSNLLSQSTHNKKNYLDPSPTDYLQCEGWGGLGGGGNQGNGGGGWDKWGGGGVWDIAGDIRRGGSWDRDYKLWYWSIVENITSSADFCMFISPQPKLINFPPWILNPAGQINLDINSSPFIYFYSMGYCLSIIILSDESPLPSYCYLVPCGSTRSSARGISFTLQ